MDRVIKEIFDVVYAPWTGVLPPLLFAVYAAIRWRGRWRVLAQIPLLCDILLFVGLIEDGIKDPDGVGMSMVFVFIPLSILWLFYLLILFLARRHFVNKQRMSVAGGGGGAGR